MAAYTQCLRCAGAPSRPGGGSGLSLPFLLGMPLSMTPGSSIIASPELRCRHRLRRDLNSSALPILPQSVSRGARISGLPDSRICYGLPSCSPPLYGSDRCARPPRAFTSRLPTDRSPSPLLDMTTTATGLLCWRDSPAEMAASLAAPDPYVPNSSIRLPPRVSDGEACIWPGMEDARFREPILDQPHDPFHRRPIFLASPPQRAPPEMGDMEMERGQPRSICRHRVIVEVAGDDLLQPLPLLGNRLMHPPSPDQVGTWPDRTWGLPVPVQRASAHARVCDHAGPSGHSRYCAHPFCLPSV